MTAKLLLIELPTIMSYKNCDNFKTGRFFINVDPNNLNSAGSSFEVPKWVAFQKCSKTLT